MTHPERDDGNADSTHERRHVATAARHGENGIRLFRAFGVAIYADWSLLGIFAIVALSLGMQVLPSWHPDWSPALIWTTAIVAAVAFFASILAHELSHALVGRAKGVPIRRITLFLFGGMAHMEKQPPTPGSELWMAIVGPITSLAIGFAATIGAWLVAGPVVRELATVDQLAALTAMGPGATLLAWLGPVNIMLGVFNLIPGFPLDGGRVLRAILWKATGDLLKATRWASFGGKVVGAFLMATGIAMMLGIWIPFFGTGLMSGLWLLLIGWFLSKAAALSYGQVVAGETLRDVPTSALMRRRFLAVPPHRSLDRFMAEYVMESDQHSFPVVADGRIVGMISAHEVRRVPPSQWEQTRVADVMLPATEIPAVSPDTSAVEALQQLESARLEQIPVVAQDGRLLGILREQDFARWLMFQPVEART
jgi:Zn-dependent protease/predicted transcriptional regulator